MRSADGAYRWHLGRSLPLHDEIGRFTGWVGTATDIDDRKRAEERQRFLVEASALLGSSLDVARTLTDVAQGAVPDVADWCVVDLVDENGTLRNLAIAHADPRKLQFVRELQERYPPAADATSGPSQVVRTGEPELVAEIPDALLTAGARDELHLDLLRELGLASYICVPLVARDRVVGTISFVLEAGGRYGPEDLLLAEELAGRAATAIDNARLYEAQQHATAEARESQARTSAIMESSLDAVVAMDHLGRVLEFNTAAERTFGRLREDVLGEDLAALIIPARYRAQHRKGLARYLETGEGPLLGRRIELAALHADGSELPVELAITRIDADGPATFTASIRDITERLEAEEERSELLAREHAARVEAEERAQAARVLATVADGVVLVDNDGVIRLWNPAAEAITGLSAAEVVGKAAAEVLHGWSDVEERIPVASEPRAGRAETVPLELAGRERWLSVAGVGFDEGTVYAFRDLTDERALELMRSDFVATVSHELRTPLAAIHGAALTLMRTDLDIADELRGRLLEIIGEESSRLAEIVNDLLLASHLDSGRLQLQIESCDGARPRRRRARRGRHASSGGRVARARRRGEPAPGRGRPRPPPAGAHEPRRQRDQVLARRRACPAGGRLARLCDALLRRGHGTRDPARRAAARVREVLPARSEHGPGRRRHRARALHLPRARADDGRPDLGRVGRGRGLDGPRRDPARRGARAGRRDARGRRFGGVTSLPPGAGCVRRPPSAAFPGRISARRTPDPGTEWCGQPYRRAFPGLSRLGRCQ